MSDRPHPEGAGDAFLPCPFCGSVPVRLGRYPFYLSCADSACALYYVSIDPKRWNRRRAGIHDGEADKLRRRLIQRIEENSALLNEIAELERAALGEARPNRPDPSPTHPPERTPTP